MKKVLLTGASGFIGRQCLAPLIRRGYAVHAVQHQRKVATGSTDDVQWHVCDLLDRAQVAKLLREIKPTHLLHCAWFAVPGKYWDAAENYQWVDESLHLFRSFAEGGGRRVVGVGTCAEYDWRFERYSETSTPLRPATTYGACKLEAGQLLDQLGKAGAFDSAWGRLFFMYGPYEDQQRLVASVITSLLRNDPALCSHGEQTRDFTHVKDVGDALVSLLDSAVTGPVNIASGEGVRVSDVVSQIGEQLGKSTLIRLGARITPPNEPAKIVADVARLRDEVGWRPEFRLAAGLQDTIKWWQAELKGLRPEA